MGSESDWPTVQHTVLTLDELGVGSEARVLSAHRSPARRGSSTRGRRPTVACR